MVDFVPPNIDLGVLENERKGLLPVPTCRHGKNIEATHDFRNIDNPENIPSLEEHWAKRGMSKSGIYELMNDLTKHEDEKVAKVHIWNYYNRYNC